MIIANGTIETKIKHGGGVDTYGNPVPPTISWGERIPCQYLPTNHDNIAMSGSGQNYVHADYTVLLEEQPFDAEQFLLRDRAGSIIGEFAVISAEPLEAVCEIKIQCQKSCPRA